MKENDILRRVIPVLKDISRVTGHSGYAVRKLPNPYRGWIDWTDEGMYCTIFDLENELGKKLRDLFLESKSNENHYDFRPTTQFSIHGRLIGRGKAKDIEWYVLQT